MPKIKIRRSDSIFSNIIREKAGWKCERCGKQYNKNNPNDRMGLHCSHYHGRSHENTRHDYSNCHAICMGCHLYFHGHPLEHTEWMIKKIGKEEFGYLRIRANLYKKKDEKLTLLWLKEEAKKYGVK